MTDRFDACSDSYSDVVASSVIGGQEHEFYIRRKVDHLLDLARLHLGEPSELVALDMGCGIGLADGLIGERLGELHGIDTSRDSVNLAANENPSVRYRSYDGDRLPYDDASFDLVFAINVAHHVDPPARAGFVNEMARVARPGGLVCVFEHNPFNPLTRFVVSRCELDEGVILLSKKTTTRLLAGAGLEHIESRYIIFVPRDGNAIARVEDGLRRLPLGAQYVVAARPPR